MTAPAFLVAAIAESGQSRTEVAEEVGITKQYLSNILTGYRDLSPYLIEHRFGPWLERHTRHTRDDLYLLIGILPTDLVVTEDALRILRAAVSMARQSGEN